MPRLQRLIAALWLGSAFFMMLAASAAFRAAPTPPIAADIVSALLTRWHYIALAGPLLLFALELRRARPAILTILFVALMLAALQGFLDLRIRAIRFSTDTPISYLDPGHPLRKQFGRLHGASSGLLLLQAILAAVVVMARERTDDEPEPEEAVRNVTTIEEVPENVLPRTPEGPPDA